MRRTLRKLAAVKPGRYLEAGAPTGLTGLFTHPAPRSTLLYLYSSTIDKLKQYPEHSVYRQSAEAVANHRLSIVTAVEPEGYAQWAERAKKLIAEHPEVFNTPDGSVAHDAGRHVKQARDGRSFIVTRPEGVRDDLTEEWDGEKGQPELEGTRSTEERKDQSVLAKERPGTDSKQITWEPEPALTAEQIEEIENKIGGGLIEEVIQVAEGELHLANILLESKVWEDLEEKPVEGQWEYFPRETAAKDTQPPPQK